MSVVSYEQRRANLSMCGMYVMKFSGQWQTRFLPAKKEIINSHYDENEDPAQGSTSYDKTLLATSDQNWTCWPIDRYIINFNARTIDFYRGWVGSMYLVYLAGLTSKKKRTSIESVTGQDGLQLNFKPEMYFKQKKNQGVYGLWQMNSDELTQP